MSFLILVVVEGLSALIRMAITKGHFKGVEIEEQGLSVSCHQFSDDTILLGEALMKNVLALKVCCIVLRSF